MTLIQQRKLFVFSINMINMHIPRIGRNFEFGSHFVSYINYNKSETF